MADALIAGCDRLLDRAAQAVGDASRTVKFLRGRARFSPRPDDVYVASYPRSGTTWTQLIAYLLVSGTDAAEFDHISDVSPWWERSLAWRSDAADEFFDLPSPRVFKTHLPLDWLPEGARYVYLRRDPADVAVSYFHLYRHYLGFRGDFGAFFDRFVDGRVQYRSWFRHVAGWEARAARPDVLVLRYEQMRADHAGAVRELAAFLDVPVDPARVRAVVAATDIDAMRAQQDKFDHVGELCRQWGVRGGAFIRAGRATSGAGYVTPAQRNRLEHASARAGTASGREWRLPDFLH